jgi:hypothetical protein
LTERGAAVEEHIAAISTLSEALLQGVDGALEEVSNVNLSTQLLSINARIEAARAGEAGSSFAVVATEMNRLSAEVKTLTPRPTPPAARCAPRWAATSARCAMPACANWRWSTST